MMKKYRVMLSILLSLALLLSISVSASATTSHSAANTAIIMDTGIFINNTFYSRNQFIQLLDSTLDESSTPQLRSPGLGALVAGTWYIPGLGEVVITAAGVILIAGVVVEVGSWAYDAVVEWFEKRAVQAAYNEAKENGEPTDDHSTESGSSLPTKGNPNSSKDLKGSDGKIKQRRYYDKDGNADMDIDYSHGGTGHTFPHRHDWVDGVRGEAY